VCNFTPVKKTLLFHITNLLGGGIEKVLIELLWGLDPAKYNIRLSVAHNLGELEMRREQIPPYVEVSYILDAPIFNNTKKKKVLNKRSVPEKLFEELVLPPFKNRAHVIKLKELIEDVDIIIDFDMTLAKIYPLAWRQKESGILSFQFQPLLGRQ